MFPICPLVLVIARFKEEKARPGIKQEFFLRITWMI